MLTVATIASLGYLSLSQASSTPSLETNMIAQVLPEETPQTLSQSPSEPLHIEVGKATYKLNEPAIQFDYDPNLFVLSSSAEGRSDLQPLLRNSTSLWSKEDYITIENAGSELGDFPDKLRLAAYSNPDGIPALDWISGRPGETLGVEIENIRQADTAVAGQETWTFSYRSLFEYDGIIFQAANGQMVVITAYRASADAEPGYNEAYLAALSTMVESMALTTPASE